MGLREKGTVVCHSRKKLKTSKREKRRCDEKVRGTRRKDKKRRAAALIGPRGIDARTEVTNHKCLNNQGEHRVK